MSIGPWQVLLILLIILNIFGAGKLPHVMKDVGKAMKNLKQEMNNNYDNQESKKLIKIMTLI